MKEKFEDISAELQVQKVLTSKYPLIYKKMTDITLENVRKCSAIDSEIYLHMKSLIGSTKETK